MSGTVAIVVAAGTSTRLGGEIPKQFLELGGISVAARAVNALAACAGVDGVVVVVAPGEIGGPRHDTLRGLAGVTSVVPGGATRVASALAGVEAASTAEFVLVHDAARPFVAPAVVASVLYATRRHGAAVPAIPARDTIKSEDTDGFVVTTLDREHLRLAQTPQGARRDWMLDALRRAVAAGTEVTDEAQALEQAGRRVALVPGDPLNVKITTPLDWGEARRRVEGDTDALRVGHGYDVHRFGGARDVAARVRDAGFRIVNLDLTVLAEYPRIGEKAGAMRDAIASCLSIDPSRVGLKATTLEGLGALGRREGIACHAVALLARSWSAA